MSVSHRSCTRRPSFATAHKASTSSEGTAPPYEPSEDDRAFRGDLLPDGRLVAPGPPRVTFPSVSGFAKHARGGKATSGFAYVRYHRNGAGSGVLLSVLRERLPS